jgi:hypothetical protein
MRTARKTTAHDATVQMIDTSIVRMHLKMTALRRQLVCQLWPLAFDHGSHFIGDDRDLLDLEHVPVQPPQVREHHDPATDDPRRIGLKRLNRGGVIPAADIGSVERIPRKFSRARLDCCTRWLFRGARKGACDDQIASEAEEKGARAVTMEVTKEQAQEILLATNIGKLSLILGRPNESGRDPNRRIGERDIGRTIPEPVRPVAPPPPAPSQRHQRRDRTWRR